MDSKASWASEPSTKSFSDWTRSREAGAASKYREKRVAEAFRNIRRCRNVELCFLVDATGSMGPHIEGVRKQVHSIVSKLTDTDPHVSFAVKGGEAIAQEMKLAFVAYRDHGDKDQFEIFSFSKSVDQFKEFVGKLVATGGADGPEDIFGGLEHAINLNWSDNAGCKIIFHICDAPCHGNEFNSGMADNYKEGDPKGRTHTALFAKLRSIGIQYHFGKINNSTDIMLKKFAEAYGEPIIDFEIKDVDKIRESVITAVSVSISASITASLSTSHKKERSLTFEKSEPEWSILPVQKGKFLSYDFPESIQAIIEDIPLEKRKPKSAEVKIAPNPFAKGAERIAYFGIDVSSYVDEKVKSKSHSVDIKIKNEKIVLKEYLHIGKGMNSAKRYELSNQLQTIAAYMARKFNEDVKKQLKLNVIIKFTKIRTLRIPGDRYMSCEIRFAKDSKFIRFTNNSTYKILEEKAVSLGVSVQFVQLVMAFSHWTYKATDGFFMIVDLEGIISKIGSGENAVLLTDPAIHCKDLTRYGPMNHGEKGIQNFFSRHKCNSYCRSLGLESVKPDSDD